jgi:ribosomal-protein-alanine N-acetyltransferase
LVGNCGLLEKEVEGRAEVELVYLIAYDAWGRGYATEAAAAVRDHALGVLGLSRLIALIKPENAASERVAEKLGMQLERDVERRGGVTMRLYVLERIEQV